MASTARYQKAVEWKRNNPDKAKLYARRSNLKRAYGVTPEWYDEAVALQGGCCAICKQPFKSRLDTHLDHCHKTGKLREFLCNNCNNGIGKFNDNIELLKAAVAYLRRHAE